MILAKFSLSAGFTAALNELFSQLFLSLASVFNSSGDRRSFVQLKSSGRKGLKREDRRPFISLRLGANREAKNMVAVSSNVLICRPLSALTDDTMAVSLVPSEDAREGR